MQKVHIVHIFRFPSYDCLPALCLDYPKLRKKFTKSLEVSTFRVETSYHVVTKITTGTQASTPEYGKHPVPKTLTIRVFRTFSITLIIRLTT